VDGSEVGSGAAPLAAPGLKSFLDADPGDQECGDGVEPPPAEQGVSGQTEEDRAGQVGAEQVPWLLRRGLLTIRACLRAAVWRCRIAITAGILAGSIALIGFGIDSAIEGFASLVIVWRFTGHRLLSHAAEERAQKLVAIQFFLLAPYVAFEAVRHLVTAHEVEISVLGMVLTATSLLVSLRQRGSERQPGRIGKRPRAPRGAFRGSCGQAGGAQPLRLVQVQTEDVATIGCQGRSS